MPTLSAVGISGIHAGEDVKKKELFESLVCASGNMAGVFEFDGDTGYFYLYEINGAQGQKIISSIWILTGTPDFDEFDISVRWSNSQNIVGLFIKDKLWAAFNSLNGEKYGGGYKNGANPEIPVNVHKKFSYEA
jgi:hypothetical protein